MSTPDTEVDAYSRGYKQGRFDSEMDRLNEEKPTPDTEDWEKEFDEQFDWIDEYISDKPTYDHYNDIKTFIANQRSSRDTYWKERVRKEPTVIEESLIEIAKMLANGSAFSKESGLIWQHVIDEAKRLCLLRDAVQASNQSELEQPITNEDNLK